MGAGAAPGSVDRLKALVGGFMNMGQPKAATTTGTPAPPPPVQAPTVAMPGYAGRPMPQFGNMDPATLARYSAENGINVPQKPNAKFPLPK